MADTQPDDQPGISPEALDRYKHQIAELEAKNAELSTTVTDLGLVDLARKHLTDKGVPASDVDFYAHKALPDLRGVEDWKGALDSEWSRVYPAEGTATEQPPTAAVPTPDAAEPPGFAKPSPAATGAPPEQPAGKIKLTPSDPRGRDLLHKGKPAIEAADKAGLIDWSVEPSTV